MSKSKKKTVATTAHAHVLRNTQKKRFDKSSSFAKEKQLRNKKRDPDNVCKPGMSFEECELTILRMATDKAEEKMAKRVVSSESIKQIIHMVEDFIRRKKVICYGGTAINNILPEEDQFYNKELEIPDYDFFSAHALDDAKELADLYYAKGYTDVEAKSGQHHGTFKLFVNYIPIADITMIPKEIFDALQKDAIKVDGILYAPPNFLRMSMYLELSRPAGDTSRWEKVLKRLTVLNKHFPVTDVNCNKVEYQRPMSVQASEEEKIYDAVRDTLVHEGCVFFGGYAISLYSQYMPQPWRTKLNKIADFDVLSNDAKHTAEEVAERLRELNIGKVHIERLEPVGEIVPLHYEIRVGKDTIAFIYQPIACHSYNVLKLHGEKVKIATIDTMLSFYLAFLYANKPYYNDFLERTLCMSKFLFDVQQKNRLQQKGLLRRFSITCYGHQETLEEIRAHKAEMYKQLKSQKSKGKPSREYEEWFLSYKPDQEKKSNAPSSNKEAQPDNHSNKEEAKEEKSETKEEESPEEEEKPAQKTRRKSRKRQQAQGWLSLFRGGPSKQKSQKRRHRFFNKKKKSYLQW